MSEPYVGEIRMFAGNFAPRNWAFCNGQFLMIDKYNTLFSLIGTSYGGNGRSDFALPDMRGRIPVHQGQGPGLTPRILGQRFGQELVTLELDQIPSHRHQFMASQDDGDTNVPGARVTGAQANEGDAFYVDGQNVTDPVQFNQASIGIAGGGQAHSNMMPTQCVSFIIALMGVYPSRN